MPTTLLQRSNNVRLTTDSCQYSLIDFRNNQRNNDTEDRDEIVTDNIS